MTGRADDSDLAGLGTAATDAVDFQLVAGTHEVDQHLVARGGITGQVAGVEEGALGGAASHENAGNTLHDC